MKKWLMSLGPVLFLCLCLSSLTGCALFGKDYIAVGAQPCPMMTYEMMDEYGMYAKDMPNFKVWMGQMILYCEEQESRLE